MGVVDGRRCGRRVPCVSLRVGLADLCSSFVVFVVAADVADAGVPDGVEVVSDTVDLVSEHPRSRIASRRGHSPLRWLKKPSM